MLIKNILMGFGAALISLPHVGMARTIAPEKCEVHLQSYDGIKNYKTFYDKKCAQALQDCRLDRESRKFGAKLDLPVCRIKQAGLKDRLYARKCTYHLFANFPHDHRFSKNARGWHFDSFTDIECLDAKKACHEYAKKVEDEKPFGIASAHCDRAVRSAY